MNKLITYLARPFEQATNEQTKTGGWVVKIKEEFDRRKIYVYDAAEQEAVKTKECLNKHIDSTHVMFINKEYKTLEEEMNIIWYNQPQCPDNIIKWMEEKNKKDSSDPNTWGDYEAVLKSNFIIARIPYGAFTVGTYFEILTAMLFKIPVYLIIPGMKYKSRMDKSMAFNKTLYKAVMNSGGKFFWGVDDCIKFIKGKYNV